MPLMNSNILNKQLHFSQSISFYLFAWISPFTCEIQIVQQ